MDESHSAPTSWFFTRGPAGQPAPITLDRLVERLRRIAVEGRDTLFASNRPHKGRIPGVKDINSNFVMRLIKSAGGLPNMAAAAGTRILPPGSHWLALRRSRRSSAIGLRRLYSWIAVRIASRFVF